MQQKPHSTTSLLAYWLICGLLGILLACLRYYILQLDYFVQWREFALAPQDAVR
jgi:hypothetical protein